MIAIERARGMAVRRALINRLKMVQRAVSSGDAETLIQHPASMTRATLTPEERAPHGISDGLVCLSFGLENSGDSWEDLAQAMAHRQIAVAM